MLILAVGRIEAHRRESLTTSAQSVRGCNEDVVYSRSGTRTVLMLGFMLRLFTECRLRDTASIVILPLQRCVAAVRPSVRLSYFSFG